VLGRRCDHNWQAPKGNLCADYFLVSQKWKELNNYGLSHSFTLVIRATGEHHGTIHLEVEG
jgi:hypothetical protein